MATHDLDTGAPQPGDELRDEAANLLSSKYGNARKEARVDGKKVDIFFTQDHFGKEFRLYVEAKDHDHRLSRSEVNSIWSDYYGIIERNRPSALLIITRRGLSPDADAFVKDELSSVRHQTIWELENDILGLTDYVRSLLHLFDQDGLSSYYIPANSRRAEYDADNERIIEGEPQDTFGLFQSWVSAEDSTPLAILGGYGAGKSSLARKIVSTQAAEALANPLARRPVLIRLGNFSRYSSIEGLLGGMFSYDFPVESFSVRRFLEMNKRGRLLILLDGFDEMKHAMSWGDFRAQVLELLKLMNGNAKVALFGRPSAFLSREEHFQVLRGRRKHGEAWLKIPGWPEFCEYDLEDFTPKDRAAFVTRYLTYRFGEKESDLVKKRSAEVNELADLDQQMFGKPVHAKILTDLAADPSVDLSQLKAGVSRWMLYDTFFRMLAEREVEKAARRPIGEKERLRFLQDVAYWLWSEKAGATAFYSQDLPAKIINALPDGDAADDDGKRREYLSGSLFEKKGGDIYYFGHRSFAEFLVAKHLMETPPGPSTHSIYSSITADGVGEFLRESPQRDQIKTWVSGLDLATGPISVEYLSFIGSEFETIGAMIDALPTGSPWAQMLACFGRNEHVFSFDETLERRVFSGMRSLNDKTFVLCYSLLNIHYSLGFWEGGRVRRIANRLAAALLDRIFLEAVPDPTSQRYWIEEDAESARRLAFYVMPRLLSRYGDRYLDFRWTRLNERMEEMVRRVGTELVLRGGPSREHPEVQDLELGWDAVLKEMRPDSRPKAEAYFRRAETLSHVTVRASRGRPG